MRREFDSWREAALMIMALVKTELGWAGTIPLGKWVQRYIPAIVSAYVAKEIFEAENAIVWDFTDEDDWDFATEDDECECGCDSNCEDVCGRCWSYR